MLFNSEVEAIWAIRGGTGSSELLAPLEVLLKENIDCINNLGGLPPLIGMSDISSLLTFFNNKGTCTILGPVARRFYDKDYPDPDTVIKLLKGEVLNESIEAYNQLDKYTISKGSSIGELIGGNLITLQGITGAPWGLTPDIVKGKILLLEEIGEYTYAIERILQHFQDLGLLDGLEGVVLGDFSNCSQGQHQPLLDVFQQFFGEKDYPVYWGFSSGHLQIETPVVLGAKYEINADNCQLTQLDPLNNKRLNEPKDMAI